MAPLWQFHVPPPPIVTERRLGLLELSGCSGTTKTQNDAVARTHANQENLMNYLAEHQNSECTTALGLTPAMYPSQSHPLPGTESLYSAPFLETCISPSVVLKASYEAPRSSSPAKLDKSLCARSSPANHVASELKPDGEDPAWVPFCSYPGRESQTDEVSLGHMDSLSAVAETLPLSRRTQLPEPRFVTAPSPSRIQSGIASDTHLDVVMQLCPPTDTPKHSISALNVVVIPDSAPSPVRDVMGSTGPVAPPLTTISSQNHLRSDKREETEPAHHRVVLIYEHTQLSPTCIGMAKTSLPLVIEKIGGSRHASQNQKADEKLDGRSLRLEKTLKRMRLSPRVFDISRRALSCFFVHSPA